MGTLVLGVDKAVGLSSIKCLRNSSEVDNIVSADSRKVAQGLYREGVKPYLLNPQDFLIDTENIIEEENIDSIVISKKDFLLKLSKYKDHLNKKGVEVLIPPYSKIKSITDKKWIQENFYEISPKIYDPKSQDINFPVVIRNRYSSLEGDIIKVFNREDLQKECEFLKEKGIEPIVQKYVKGSQKNEYLVPLLYSRERELKASMVIKILSKNWKFWGKIVASKTIEDSKLLDLAKRIGKSLRCKGPLTLLFKKNPKGKFKLLNVKPLLWESQWLAKEAGINFPEMLVKITEREEVGDSFDYRIGMKSVRKTFYNVVKRHRVIA